MTSSVCVSGSIVLVNNNNIVTLQLFFLPLTVQNSLNCRLFIVKSPLVVIHPPPPPLSLPLLQFPPPSPILEQSRINQSIIVGAELFNLIWHF